MRNARPFILIAISLLIGLVAVVTAAQWVKNRTNVATTKVVVASRDLQPGTKLDASMLEAAEFPAATVLNDTFKETAAIDGRVVTTHVVRGEPLLATKLAKPGEQAGLAAMLAPGQRAITVKVNDVISVAGFTMPGSYVDLVVNTTDDNNKPLSKIVLERVLVLAVAQEMTPGEKSKVQPAAGTVTLAVTPEQAEQVDLARSIGQLAFALRNSTDTERVVTGGARRSDLLKAAALATPANGQANGASAPAAAKKVVVVRAPVAKPVPAAAPKNQFEVIRGVKKSTEEFPAETKPS